MTATEHAEVMEALGRLEARLGQLERAVREAPRKERIRVEKLVDGLIASARERVDAEQERPCWCGDTSHRFVEKGLHFVP